MTKEKNKATNEEQIRELVDNFVKALRAKDIPKIMSHYAPDILVFDILPPLQYKGTDAYQKNWEGWFSTFEGPIDYEIRDLKITLGDDVAFTHSLNHIGGKRKNGEEADTWVRVTVGFRKIDGQWRVTHEHISVPFYMDGSDKAAVDLKP